MATKNQTRFTGAFLWGKDFFKPLKKQIHTNVGGFWIHDTFESGGFRDYD
jgi:hypothetical protein